MTNREIALKLNGCWSRFYNIQNKYKANKIKSIQALEKYTDLLIHACKSFDFMNLQYTLYMNKVERLLIAIRDEIFFVIKDDRK